MAKKVSHLSRRSFFFFFQKPPFSFFPGKNIGCHVRIWRTKVSGTENDISGKRGGGKKEEGEAWYFGERRAIGEKLEISFVQSTSRRIARPAVRLIYIHTRAFFTDVWTCILKRFDRFLLILVTHNAFIMIGRRGTEKRNEIISCFK